MTSRLIPTASLSMIYLRAFIDANPPTKRRSNRNVRAQARHLLLLHWSVVKVAA